MIGLKRAECQQLGSKEYVKLPEEERTWEEAIHARDTSKMWSNWRYRIGEEKAIWQNVE